MPQWKYFTYSASHSLGNPTVMDFQWLLQLSSQLFLTVNTDKQIFGPNTPQEAFWKVVSRLRGPRRDDHCPFRPVGVSRRFQRRDLPPWLVPTLILSWGKGAGPMISQTQETGLFPDTSGTCLTRKGVEKSATEPRLWLCYLISPWICLSTARKIRLYP